MSQKGNKLNDILSEDAMRKLVSAYPGLEIDVPIRPTSLTDTHWLVLVVGYDDALKIVKVMGGTRVYVGKMFALEKQIRDQEILKRYNAGERVKQLARDYDLSQRAIEMILSKTTECGDLPQGRLREVPIANFDLFE